MSSITVQRTLAGAIRIFPVDQRRSAAPFRKDGTQTLVRDFDPVEVVVQGGERPIWKARKGKCQIGSRQLLIEEIHGNEYELGVVVEGKTPDAMDTLNEIWARLAPRDDDTALADVPGEWFFQTGTVFTSTKRYNEVLPLVANANSKVVKRLKHAVLEDGEPFQVQIPFTLSVSGVVTKQFFTLERRFAATSDERVYWCKSPLDSTDHEALLRELFS